MARVLNIQINSPEMERLIDKHIGESGLYENDGELVRDAMRRLFMSLEREDEIDRISENFMQGYRDLGQGNYAAHNTIWEAIEHGQNKRKNNFC